MLTTDVVLFYYAAYDMFGDWLADIITSWEKADAPAGAAALSALLTAWWPAMVGAGLALLAATLACTVRRGWVRRLPDAAEEAVPFDKMDDS